MFDAMDKEAKILLDACQASIPASPFHLAALARQIGTPNADINELAKLILQDFGLTFYYLKWANSAFFSSGVHEPPISMAKIIMMLGLDNISAALKDVPTLSGEQLAASDPYKRCQMVALAKATLAGRIAGKISEAKGSSFELSSLLAMCLSLGECITALAFPRVAILLDSMKDDKERNKMARRFLFYTPEGLGLRVASRWNLPEAVVQLLNDGSGLDWSKDVHKDLASCVAYGVNKFLCAAKFPTQTSKRQKEALFFLEKRLQFSFSALISLASSGVADLKGDNPAFYQVLYDQGLLKRLPIY